MGRGRSFPPDDVTTGEWRYLEKRYPKDEAAERRERLRLTIKRLVGKGHDAEPVHRALMQGIQLWRAHPRQQGDRQVADERNALIARAQKDVDQALASLRRLLPSRRMPDDPELFAPLTPDAEGFASLTPDDDELFAMRDVLLTPIPRAPSRPRGRPSEWRTATEDALRQAGVGASARRELLLAVGFAEET